MKSSRIILFAIAIALLIWIWYAFIAYQSSGSGTVTNSSNIQNIDFIENKIDSAEQ